jgi:hypothetical protein
MAAAWQSLLGVAYILMLFDTFLLFAFEVQPSFSANVCPAQIIFHQGPQDAPGRLGEPSLRGLRAALV